MPATTDTKSYRYPGVRPFNTNDSDVFFGREDDTSRLFKLIMLEKSVILFGKSGYGKSSLINAGILPRLKAPNLPERFQYFPIVVRIGKVSGQNESPVNKVISKLDEQLSDLEQWDFLDKYENSSPLWSHFKKKQSGSNRKFILIFDQFEEFFTYSSKEQEAFNWQLAELLYTEIPQNLRESIDDVEDDKYALLSVRFDIKVLFSIRSDRLSLLHSMNDALPGVLNSRYEITGLKPDQAKRAIQLPASIQNDKYATHSFSYEDSALHIILKELLTVQGDGSEIIEAFHLQIICQACESTIEAELEKGIIDREVNVEDLPEFDNLYEEYYKRQIDKLPPDLRGKAQSILEEGLIFENAETNEHRRLSVDGNILRRQLNALGVREDLLDMMENTFLIRREPNTVGGFSYEVSHDTIIEPIIKIKRERQRDYQLLIHMEEVKRNTLKESAIKQRKQVISASCIFLVLLAVAWNWKEIYLGYQTLTNKDPKPYVRLDNKLIQAVADLKDEVLKSAQLINLTDKVESWDASTMMFALKGIVPDSIKNNFYKLTGRSIADTACCCWVEVRSKKDFRPTGWIVSTIGDLNMTNKYHCNVLNFFLNNQLDDGAWSMYQIDKSQTKYSSTYATCHILRALHNSIPNVTDKQVRKEINQAIRNGVSWLMHNMKDPEKSIWTDYPQNREKEDLLSLSLSGLAIHTLNLLNASTVQLNRQWLNNLKKAQAFVGIAHKEQNDMVYRLNSVTPDFQDPTRHLIVPWEVIATVDAYKDGNFSERFRANEWLDIVVDNLNIENIIEENPMFVKSEILISLRYLQDKSYLFH